MAKGAWRKAKTASDSLSLKSLPSEKKHIASRSDYEDESDTFRKKKMDALTEHLGCSSYFHKMRWPWFIFEFGGLNYPMEVDRYYHEKKLAIDFGLTDKRQIEQKREMLDLNGISYVVIESATDLKSLAKGLS
jgi:hypothetical protein